MNKVRIITLLVAVTVCFTGCSNTDRANKTGKEMLIYCGITMIKPMQEIAANFEQEHNCSIILTQGGSEDLYQSLKFSSLGELYLPGSHSYRSKHMDDGLLTDYVDVGYNQAALIVQKGNPKQIPADIMLLADDSYATVIGNPESCSIGRQSKKILTKLGIFNDVMTHSVLIAADSRTMNRTITDKSADVILNWGATAFFDENKDFMDRIALDESIAPKNTLQISLLSFARDPELARKFMLYAVSVKGQEIFHKFGFLEAVGPPGVIRQ